MEEVLPAAEISHTAGGAADHGSASDARPTWSPEAELPVNQFP